MPRSTRNDRVGNRMEGDQYSFEGGRGRECPVERYMMLFRMVKHGFAGAS